ncbi:shikimate dehydrogenase [Quadrisphaera sp. DSM 44207]|uniref:shikimate dehydrogenase n=1 Tax=Quadrisphaera sp. DSM 44207 TaxID=1881057 RepID=UPI00088CD838|nr:shikimate dehydrogenase [Quadrisphaera sp. DSM 44207]SDQ46958.1 shikimate dehydrogenase [Quadrisphaera sp. DSM 44207]
MRAAVLGHPVAHSLSPVLHTAAYAALGLVGRWRYSALDVQEHELAPLLASLDVEWGGLSLTMPLKQVALPLLDEVSPLAAAVGAVNTLLPMPGPMPEPGQRLRWRGENTDVHGLVAALREAGVQRATSAAVLGGGATAASALAALRVLGVREPTVHVRSPLRAAALHEVADRLGVALDVAPWERAHRALGAQLVVSTVPAGAADDLAAQLSRPSAGAAGAGVLLDVVYAPWPTALARAWSARGGAVVSGFAMLLHQAGEQVRMMTGHEAPLEVMRRAGEDELAARSR